MQIISLKSAITFPSIAFSLFTISAPTYGQSVQLGFPIANVNPYRAPIITVLDHSAATFYDRAHTAVAAYTGEFGKDKCGPSGQPCGYYNAISTSFVVNANYTGTSADGADARKVLNYRGHSGYDYGYGSGTPIVAAGDGTLYIPAKDPVNGSDPWCAFHTFYIDHGNGWTTWYLHAATLSLPLPTSHHDCSAGHTSITSDERIGEVRKGDIVAVVGNVGVPGYHLHFEARKNCAFTNGAIGGCLVVDPYGWEWPGDDPILGNSLAAAQTIPLWDLAPFNVQQPAISNVQIAPSSGGYAATISGSGFNSNTTITLWDRSNAYYVATVSQTSVNAAGTQLLATLPTTAGSDLSGFVIKASTPQGPRSRGFIVSTSAVVPTFTGSGVVNSANYGRISPGALASIFGTNFASIAASAVSTPLPTELTGTRVTVNGIAAPLLYAGPGQINFQVPWETAVGTASVVVTANGASSSAVAVPVLSAAPGLFVASGTPLIQENQAFVQNSDYTLNGPDNPAKAGSTIIAYVTGSGAVNPPIPTGAAAPSSPLSLLTLPYSATLWPETATVAFAGLTPGLVGLTQMNIVVPPGLGTGRYLLSVTINGQTSNANVVSVVASGTGTPVCATYPAGFIPFNSVYYVTAPNSSGDRLLVGVSSLSNYQVVQSLPLPATPNQQFCGIVTLANGYAVVAYVPTAAERTGNFSAFAGLLIDPLANVPFPGGIIPLSRQPNTFAWRIPSNSAPPAAPTLNAPTMRSSKSSFSEQTAWRAFRFLQKVGVIYRRDSHADEFGSELRFGVYLFLSAFH